MRCETPFGEAPKELGGRVASGPFGRFNFPQAQIQIFASAGLNPSRLYVCLHISVFQKYLMRFSEVRKFQQPRSRYHATQRVFCDPTLCSILFVGELKRTLNRGYMVRYKIVTKMFEKETLCFNAFN